MAMTEEDKIRLAYILKGGSGSMANMASKVNSMAGKSDTMMGPGIFSQTEKDQLNNLDLQVMDNMNNIMDNTNPSIGGGLTPEDEALLRNNYSQKNINTRQPNQPLRSLQDIEEEMKMLEMQRNRMLGYN